MEDKILSLELIKKEIENANYTAALGILESIFDLNEYDIAFEYAKTLYILKRFDKAIEILLSVNKKFPNKKDALDILIKSYKESGRTEDLFDFISGSVVIDEINILFDIAEALFSEKKYKESVKFYEKYMEKDKDNINIASKLLQIYNFLGQKTKASDLAAQYLRKEEIKNDVFYNNLFLNELEIAQEKIELLSKPRIMLVMLTNKCNLKCPMCATVNQANVWEISDNFKKYILDNLGNLELITWQGGEVFLYKDFEKLFLAASKNTHLKQIIITNGLLINAHWANLFASANQLDLTISIDSIEKNVYEKLRCGAKFETLLENLDLVKQARQKNNSNITVTMRTTVSDENIYTLDKMADFAVRYGLDIMILSPLIGENNKKYDCSAKTIDELRKINMILTDALEKASKNNIKVINLLGDIGQILHEKQNIVSGHHHDGPKIDLCQKNDDPVQTDSLPVPICFRPWKQLATTVEGEIKPECMCLKKVGNIHECNDFYEVWNNDFMQQYRKQLLNFNQQLCCESCKNNIVSEEHKKFVCW